MNVKVINWNKISQKLRAAIISFGIWLSKGLVALVWEILINHQVPINTNRRQRQLHINKTCAEGTLCLRWILSIYFTDSIPLRLIVSNWWKYCKRKSILHNINYPDHHKYANENGRRCYVLWKKRISWGYWLSFQRDSTRKSEFKPLSLCKYPQMVNINDIYVGTM